MTLFIDFIIMVVVAILAMVVTFFICAYLDKCVQSISTTGKKVTFTCVITVMLWVILAAGLDPFR